MEDSGNTLVSRLVRLFDASGQGFALFDAADTLRYANRVFRHALGLREDEFPTWVDLMRLGRERRAGTHVQTDDFETWLRSALSRRGKQPYRMIETSLEDGRWVLMTETTLSDGWMLCVLTDVTNLRAEGRDLRQERDLALRAAMSDELTGLSSRRYVLERLEGLLRQDGVPRCTVAMFDLDFFKRVNDTYGHDVGDLVLRHFGATLQANIRRGDVAGRVGGEEFLLLLPDLPRVELDEVIGRVLQAVRRSVPVPDLPELRYTCSAGVAFAVAGDSSETLLKRADQALYDAKRSGRDRFCVDARGL